jgi:hypothetical protein
MNAIFDQFLIHKPAPPTLGLSLNDIYHHHQLSSFCLLTPSLFLTFLHLLCLCILGISEAVSDYVTELYQAKEKGLERERTPQTKDDIAFAQTVSFFASDLLLLGTYSSIV